MHNQSKQKHCCAAQQVANRKAPGGMSCCRCSAAAAYCRACMHCAGLFKSLLLSIVPHLTITMNRKWRTNPSAIDTVASYPAFRAAIPPRDSAYDLSTPTDLYAVYTVLHIESKQAELRWSPHGRFYYFQVQWWQAAKAGEGPAAAPEGDEDPPPQVRPAAALGILGLLPPCCVAAALHNKV